MSVRSKLSNAATGDLVVAMVGGPRDPAVPARVVAIEQVADHSSAPDIVDRWKAQGIVDGLGTIELWEARAGFHYRRKARL